MGEFKQRCDVSQEETGTMERESISRAETQGPS